MQINKNLIINIKEKNPKVKNIRENHKLHSSRHHYSPLINSPLQHKSSLQLKSSTQPPPFSLLSIQRLPIPFNSSSSIIVFHHQSSSRFKTSSPTQLLFMETTETSGVHRFASSFIAAASQLRFFFPSWIQLFEVLN